MGRLGCFAIVLVLLVVGYDQYRIEQMRSEVSAMSSKLHVATQSKSAKNKKPDLVTTVAEAERHTRKAKELLREKKTAAAQVELDKALKSFKSANSVSQDMAGDAAEFMGKARDNAVKMFQKAWTDISEEAKQPKKDIAR